MDTPIRSRRYIPPPVRAEFPSGGEGRIAIVGHIPSADDEASGKIFSGSQGYLLNQLLSAAKINRANILLTNVFQSRPPNGNMTRYFVPPTQYAKLIEGPPAPYHHYVGPGILPSGGQFKGYLRPEYHGELDRLRAELETAKPNIVIALGPVALWALTGHATIGTYRGTVIPSNLVEAKVMPTWHPETIQRQFRFKAITGQDFAKARRESLTPALVVPEREVWIRPTLQDLAEFERLYMESAKQIAYDIETDPWNTMLITCIGFAPSEDVAIVVPFEDLSADNYSYWPTAEEEFEAVMWCQRQLARDAAKITHNGSYDAQWNFHKLGLVERGEYHDTMLMAHAIQPELPKTLGMMASLYTNDGAWKHMATFKSNKRGA